MRGIRLLIKNAFKSAFRNIYQILGLSMLVLLVALIASLTLSTSSSVIDANARLSQNSVLRDEIVTIDNEKLRINLDDSEKDDLNISYTNSQDIYQTALINKIAEGTKSTWSRTEGRTFSGLKNNGTDLLVKTIAKFSNVKKLNQNDAMVDRLVVSDGSKFSDDTKIASHQTVLQKTFAEQNHIKIGDIVRFASDSYSSKYGSELVVTKDNTIKENLKKELHGKDWAEGFADTEYIVANWFQVIGFGESADFSAPIIDQTTTLPNIFKNMIAYVDASAFGFIKNEDGTNYDYQSAKSTLTLVSDNDREVYFSFKAPTELGSQLFDTALKAQIKMEFKLSTDADFVYSNDDSGYLYYSRVHMFVTVAQVFNIVTTTLLLIVAIIAAMTIVLITRKYVESIQKQIGCLKALGYKKREIVNNFVALPLITSAIGSILGYSISIGVGQGVLLAFKHYFNVDFGGISFNLWAFLAAILGTFTAMLIIALIASYIIIRHAPLVLLKGEADRQSGVIARQLKKMTISKGFDGRLRGALMAASAGKLFAMSGVILLSTILMSATMFAPKIMKDNETKSFDGILYQNSVEYTTPVWNNPLSFFRTYNPISEQNVHQDGWGMKKENGELKDILDNILIDQGSTGGSKPVDPTVASAISNLPYLYDEENNATGIDKNKVLQELFENKIPYEYYSYDLTTKTGAATAVGWAKMAYLGWTSVPMEFLKTLIDTDIVKGLMDSAAIGQLSQQWPDYAELAKTFKTKGIINSEEDQKSLTTTLLAFYKKYTSGLPIKYNEKNDTDFKTFSGVFKNLDTTEGLSDQILTEDNYNAVKFDNGVPTFTINDDDSVTDLTKLSLDSLRDIKDYNSLSCQLLRWFYGTAYNQLGVILLETAFSRAPYFVQQKMLSAYLNNSNYALTFNILPYNEQTDDLGTMLNAKYKTSIGDSADIKIYGIDQDEKTIDIKSKFIDNLFKKNDELTSFDDSKEVPIVLNQTALKKTGKKIGDSIDMNYLFSELQNNNQTATYDGSDSTPVTDIKLKPGSGFVANSQLAYYAKDGAYTSGTMGTINESAKVAGIDIAGVNSTASTGVLPLLDAATNGQVKINDQYLNRKFKIVGQQDSYGQATAWISNINANKLLKYDEEQKNTFTNLFAPQFEDLFINNKDYDFIPDYMKNSQYDDSLFTNFDELMKKVNDGDEAANNVYTLFKNAYPIYNYKNSLDETNYDLDQIVSTDQRFGDYSSMGLNGGIVEVNKVERSYAGLGQGSTSLIYPVTTARQILEQITDLVDTIIILFIVIAFVVSLTMIILTTSLVIKENISFIATMKILGYSDQYIVTQILGMYIAGILISFVVGFLISWFGLVGLGGLLATHSTWVLPISFYWWYPISVFALLLAVYWVSSAIGYTTIRKINPLVALQYEK